MKDDLKSVLSKLELDNITGILEFLEDLDEGIMIVDKNYKIIYYSDHMEHIESLKSEDVLGKNLFEVFPNKSIENSTIYKSITEGIKVIDKIEENFTNQGTPISIINSTVPLLKDGQVIAALDINKDLDKIIKARNRLPKKSNPLEECWSFSHILSNSSRMVKAINYGKRAAMQEAPVLLTGETGTGKELFAQSIHYHGLRSKGPFLAINCSAIPAQLIEAILFGTEKGGFTGAVDRVGLFEQADNGTLLLDEINSMDFHLQAKLLRVLQEGTFRRVGGKDELHSNARIISTTNSDLIEAITEKKFRSDLFYRLSVISIEIPSLRERENDIDFLAKHFLRQFSTKLNRPQCNVDDSVLRYFNRYPWPGNIRELRNVIEGILCLKPDDTIITLSDLPDYVMKVPKEKLHNLEHSDKVNGKSPSPNLSGTLRERLQVCEKDIIINEILKTGNITKAAAQLGLKRQSLQARMKKLGIHTRDFKPRYEPD